MKQYSLIPINPLKSTRTKPLLQDQYAFRPTGSAMAVIISILQQITNLHETNGYMSLMAIDSSKAFDRVLVEKQALLEISDNIFNCLTD